MFCSIFFEHIQHKILLIDSAILFLWLNMLLTAQSSDDFLTDTDRFLSDIDGVKCNTQN